MTYRSKSFLLLALLILALAGCAPASSAPQPAPTLSLTQASPTTPPTAIQTDTLLPGQTPTEAETMQPTITPTGTPLPTHTYTPTPTPQPTYAKLRGKVTIEQAVCHYGPGAPYLYKYGVYQGSNLEVLRRVKYGNYIEIQAIGGNNPCWVRVDYLDIQGNWLALEPVDAADFKLPITPYYASPGGVSASRNGNEVTISWNPLILKAGDDSEQVPYIVEAWVCQDGDYKFLPTGSWTTSVTIRDEPGCEQPSRGFFTAAEKHGYTPRVTIPWP